MPPLTSHTQLVFAIQGDSEHGTIKEHRALLIQLRDEALKQGHMDWAVSLSHSVAYLSNLMTLIGEPLD